MFPCPSKSKVPLTAQSTDYADFFSLIIGRIENACVVMLPHFTLVCVDGQMNVQYQVASRGPLFLKMLNECVQTEIY